MKDISVILITHNRFFQTRITLYSLMFQNFDLSRVEVIVVDDFSTDRTKELEKFKAPFSYKYIRTPKIVGRANAKDIGVQSAIGNIVIFLDGEVMVDPEFIKSHVTNHEKKDGLVVAGTQNHYCAFTVLEPNLTRDQVNHAYSIVKGSPLFYEKFGRVSSANFLRQLKKRKIPLKLISRSDVKHQLYKQLSFHLPCFPNVVEKFGEGLIGYHMPWTFCITRNASIPMNLLKLAGPFNKQFSGWGYEDWELGYRLYKAGATFIEEPKIYTYHQEHPYSPKNREREQYQNYLTFSKLHPDIGVCLFSLDLLKKKSLIELNEIISDFYRLSSKYPDDFIKFRNSFLVCLQKIIELLAKGKPVTNLFKETGLEEQAQNKLSTLEEYEKLKQLNEYNNLVEAFDIVLGL